MTTKRSTLSLFLVHARGRRGLALVAVLWVLMLLSLVAASFMATTRTEVNLTRNQIENARAEAVTETGAVFVREAVVGLTGDSDRPFEFYAWRQGKRAAAGNGQAD